MTSTPMTSATYPKISILTPSFNQAQFIEQTIRSVSEQPYPCVEHIVLDGGSTDGTLDILRRYPHLRWVSGRDGGQADALNRGLRMATGDIIGWINSDDYYAEGIFPAVAAGFQASGAEWSVGDVTDVCDDAGLFLNKPSRTVTFESLVRDPDVVRQQGTFFTRHAIERAGGWDPDLFMVMDYDLWLRLARSSAPLMTHADTARFRIHAAQKSTRVNLRRQYLEIDRVLRREGASSRLRSRILFRKKWYYAKAQVKAGLARCGLLNVLQEALPLSDLSAVRRSRESAI